MSSLNGLDLNKIAQSLQLTQKQVAATVALLDADNTVPFITRYRKDQTGGLDEEQIRAIEEQVGKQRLLADRKETILRSIRSQGKLTAELETQITQADSIKLIEDLYLPYKPKKQTRATLARDRGLEPLANEILSAAKIAVDLDRRAADFVNPDHEVNSVADALLGAGHILAERYSERADLRQKVREIYRRSGFLVSSETGSDEKKSKAYRDYFSFREPIDKIPPHRILAINRGEKAKVLKVKIEADTDSITQAAEALLLVSEHPHREFLEGCIRDALARLVIPSLEREVRRELTEKAETHAVEVFARNLRNLLLQPPVKGRRVLAIDPGFKNGCKLAALDSFGSVLAHCVVHVVGAEERIKLAREKIVTLIQEHDLSVIAIGNGTACRETEELIADIIAGELAEHNISYVIVNEAGASVYSASALAREELPDYDAMVRGAVSIGRRLQDPLSELVKIDPASIGVGLYQHDVKAKHLRSSLDAVVESCVNYVGVDLNSASPALLGYVSGLNSLTARRVYEHRSEHGPFRSRQELLQVPGFGNSRFVQAAGFLKIGTGDNPLDATWIHPESYPVAEKMLARLDAGLGDLKDSGGATAIAAKSQDIDVGQLAVELGTGELLLQDIIQGLSRPGRDPREDLAPPVFRKGIVKLEDLQPGMELQGTVLNVVDFGAFVDIGLHDSGLVHISQIANRYVQDPHEVVAVGKPVRVWVKEIDKERRRVALTMIEPGTEKPRESRRRGGKPKPSDRPPRERTPAGKAKSKRGRPQGERAGKPHRKPQKKKPVVPLTKEMEEGNEPMRTFGDLLQFYEKKKDGSE